MKFLLICLAGALQLAPVMSVPALGIKLPTIDSEVEQGQDLSELIANLAGQLLYTLSAVQNKLEALEENHTSLQETVNHLQNNAVPIGFVYVQLPSQPEPSTIWPNSTWINISGDYAGLFFRTEGGSSAAFGNVQSDSTRQITRMQNTYTSIGQGFPNPQDIPRVGYSQYGHVGHYSSNSQYSEGLRFYTEDVEVRPRNMAMRVWKRTG